MRGKVIYLVGACALLVLASALPATRKHPRIHEDAILTTPQLITKYGYPVEIHHVTTEDGYILEMHRIPYGKASPPGPDKPVVFMQHGLLSENSDYILMGPEKGLAYMVADLGYDVWLGNSRGNTYSRHHVTLDPDAEDGAFWDFTWHELGIYDIPAEIDHMLATTGQDSLVYIGHSQGTTQFYVTMSERPEYNSKVKAMFSLAPVAYMSNIDNPLLQELIDIVGPDNIDDILGVHEFLPHSDVLTSLADKYCNDGDVTQPICENILFLICGFDSEQLNSTMIPIIAGHHPAGASTRQMVHYGQLIGNGKFQQYDHGPEENINHYGSEEAPPYDLSKITCPVYLHYGVNDVLSSPLDVAKLHAELGNSAGLFEVPHPKFNHLDFLWAIDVIPLLYDLLISQINEVTNS